VEKRLKSAPLELGEKYAKGLVGEGEN